jgi:hypothetical protein
MNIPEHIQQAIQAYYAERATDAHLAALEDWFREDDANVRIFAEHGLVEWHMLCEHEKQEAAAILATLREAEEKAEPDFSLLSVPVTETAASDPGEDSVTFKDLWSIAGYLTAKGLRSKTGVIGAVAAMLVLAAVLYLSIFGLGSTPEQPELADDTPGSPEVESFPVVATLTAQRNARWEAASLSPGDALHSGQRLILTQGSAQITTAQGAIAVLQAPCSVEMIGGDNALRLVRGELAARVDTDEAKGFTVFLPQNSKLIDLGTAFRVSVDHSGRADCLVTEGEVVWQPEGQDHASALIVAGQTAQLVDGRPIVSDVVEVFSEDFEGYTAADEYFYADGQLDTGLKVAHRGSLPGWTHKGFNSIHAVDHANRAGSNAYTPDYAAMVIIGQMQTAINGANEAGQQYEMSFLAGPAVYKDREKRTTADDRLLIELARRDGTVLASHTHRSGAWQGQMALFPDRFTYRGDGSGELTLRIRSVDAGLHDITSETSARKNDNRRFAGAIDDLSIRVIDAAQNHGTDQDNRQP